MIIAIAGIVSFASLVQPAAPVLTPNPMVIRTTIVGQGPATEALFGLDAPAAGPFPSDWFTVPEHTNNTHRRVSLPLPDCRVYVSDCEDTAVLNELDGFNLQPRLSVPFNGPIDPNTVTSETMFLVSLGNTGPGQDYMPWGTMVGINQVVWDPFTNALHVESDALLAQHTRFALIVTRGVRDNSGARVEASDEFRRFRATVREEYKKALLDAIQVARHVGVHEDDIAVASVFTTQSATSVLEKIRDQIHAAPTNPADFLLGPNRERTVFSLNQVAGLNWDRQTTVNSPPTSFNVDLSLVRSIFPGAVAHVAFGKYKSPDYQVHPGEYIPPVGTRSGTPAVQGTSDIYFNLFLPSGREPANGWPVAIVGHGINGDKNNFPLNVASSMANIGIATIAINAVGHGFGSLSTLTVKRSDGGSITFSEGGRGIDQDGNGLITSNEGLATPRPRNVVYLSDGLRQTVVDLMQLVRVIDLGMDVDGDGHRDLDSSRIYYFGQSLGGGYGTIFLSVEPDVRAGVLAAPVDTIPVGNLSLTFRPAAAALFASREPSLLKFPGVRFLDGCEVGQPYYDDNMPLRDQIPLRVQLADSTSITRVIQSPVTNTVAGAGAIQEAGNNLEWVGQAASPTAYAPHLRKAPLASVPAKSVLFLIAKGDQSAPNPTTTAILREGELADRTLYYRHDLYYQSLFPSTLTKNPHGFAVSLSNVLLRPISLGVQGMMGNFFFSDGVLLTVPEPSLFFEFPIPLPLPENLNYIR